MNIIETSPTTEEAAVLIEELSQILEGITGSNEDAVSFYEKKGYQRIPIMVIMQAERRRSVLKKHCNSIKNTQRLALRIFY